MRAVLSSLVVLRANLLRCLGLLALGMTIVVLMHRTAADAVDRQARETERRAALKAGIEAGAGGAAQVEAGNAYYRDLMARGVVGTERRLDWVQQISRIKETRRLPDMEYELAPQQAVVEPDAMPMKVGRYEFRTSTMRLHIGLLHEGDLLDFFDELGKSVPAIPRVRACRVERLAEASPAARLNADCSIDWITLQEKP